MELRSHLATLDDVELEDQIADNLPVSPAQLPQETRVMQTPNDPPWNTAVAFGMWFLSILLIFIVPIFFIGPYFIISGRELTPDVQNDPTVIFLSVLAVIPAHLLTLAAAWPLVTHFRKYKISETLGLSWGGYKWWHFGAMLGGIFAAVMIVSHYLPEQDNDLTRILESSRAVVYLVAFLATLTAPVVEEVIYRGILYSALQRSIGSIATIAIVTAMFAGVHFFQYWGSPGTLILITLLSLTLTLVRYSSRNLLPCIVMHMLFNGAQSIFLIVGPYLDKPEVKEQTAAILWLLR